MLRSAIMLVPVSNVKISRFFGWYFNFKAAYYMHEGLIIERRGREWCRDNQRETSKFIKATKNSAGRRSTDNARPHRGGPGGHISWHVFCLREDRERATAIRPLFNNRLPHLRITSVQCPQIQLAPSESDDPQDSIRCSQEGFLPVAATRHRLGPPRCRTMEVTPKRNVSKEGCRMLSIRSGSFQPSH